MEKTKIYIDKVELNKKPLIFVKLYLGEKQL